MSTPRKLKVEVWSDVVCPFCYIGKRNYEKALSAFANRDDIELEFKNFQLDPNFIQDPANKANIEESLAEKYNKPVEEIHRMQQHIVNTAKAAGLEYHMDKAVRFNTFDAHRLLQKANEKGLGAKLEEALFAGYFTEGKNLGDKENLKKVALEVGLSEQDFHDAMNDEEYAIRVDQDIQEAAKLGITGVPFFVFNRKYAVNGAQPIEVFSDTLTAAFEDWKNDKGGLKTVNHGATCDINGNCD